MPMGRGRIKRLCQKCSKMFKPTGKTQRVCEPCQKKIMKRVARDRKRKFRKPCRICNEMFQPLNKGWGKLCEPCRKKIVYRPRAIIFKDDNE